MHTLNIDAGKLESFEIGALLIAILAFPDAGEIAERTAVQQAWCTEQLFVTVNANPEIGDEFRERFPHYFELDQGTIRKRLRKTRTRYRDRMVAARMARGFFQEALTNAPALLPEGMTRLSLNELSKLVLPESGQSDPDNIEKRAWTQSRLVIHLAAAFDLYGLKTNPGAIALQYDLQDLDAHRAVVSLACLHEQRVLADPRFGKRRDEIVRLRWIE